MDDITNASHLKLFDSRADASALADDHIMGDMHGYTVYTTEVPG
jgi:hypothetical protein